MIRSDEDHHRDIAIIGLQCRFPGAANVDQYWSNLRDGVESIGFFTDEELLRVGVPRDILDNPNFVKASPVLEDVDLFDAAFFGFNPREADVMDPQFRVFLECAWEALEHAGYDPDRCDSPIGPIGIYAGANLSNYFVFHLFPNLDKLAAPGGGMSAMSNYNDRDALTTVVSYKLNLTGPSVAVQTFCSTSLVAVHLACNSLLIGECGMALAGGISISSLQGASGYFYEQGGIKSQDGHCRPFDSNASGTVFGSGAGLVVLRRLADAIADGDAIHAVIKGTAVNNDGALKAGFTAPSVVGQAKVIAEALTVSGLNPETIGYVEAHGTGTAVGDPIEIDALTRAFRKWTDRTGFCKIGSVKSNVGHLDRAAGVAGLLKATLAVKHGWIPPSLHFEAPNSSIDFDASPLQPAIELTRWQPQGVPRRAAVSSLGIGGTNAHAIVEQPPILEPSAEGREHQLLLVSARTPTALDNARARLGEHLRSHPQAHLADVAFTLAMGRRAFSHRSFAVCRDVEEAVAALAPNSGRLHGCDRLATGAEVAFMFPGQGAQHVRMGAGLYENEPVFREVVDRCAEVLEPELGLDIRGVMYAEGDDMVAASERLGQTALTQPTLFVTEYALARLLMAWGLQPAAMIGHSIGEYVAACLAGVFAEEDALRLVAVRGRLMQELPAGSMLALPLPEHEVAPLLDGKLAIAAVNSSAATVVSGADDAIDGLRRRLAATGVEGRVLHTSHAFHSPMMDPILDRFTAEAERSRPQPPQLPFVSNLTGTWITDQDAADPRYWSRHLRHAVRFADGVHNLLDRTDRVLLEVGPGTTLRGLARQDAEAEAQSRLVPAMRHPQQQGADLARLLEAVGSCWALGVDVDWPAFYGTERRRRIPLPTYPFDRQRYWVDAQAVAPRVDDDSSVAHRNDDVGEWFYTPSWRRAGRARDWQPDQSGDGAWLLLADGSSFATTLVAELRAAGRTIEVVHRDVGGSGDVPPGDREDWIALLEGLRADSRLPARIVHLWSLNGDANGDPLPAYERDQQRGFFSLLAVAQALGALGSSNPIRIGVVTDRLHSIAGELTPAPERATVLGPVKVVSQEYSEIDVVGIDVLLPEPAGEDEQRLARQVLAEVDGTATEPVIALRGDHRWEQTFERSPLPEAVVEIPRFKHDGVYLITGGLGGIGLTLGRYLGEKLAAKLVLTGRTALPPAAEWDDWLTNRTDEASVCQKILRLRELQNAGAEVLAVNADSADLQGMRTVVRQALERFGRIDGVIHAAGVAGDGVIQLKSPEVAASVLAPKVKGTLVLNEVLRDAAPDFIVLCSSIAAVTGGFGQVDYTASTLR